MIRTIAHFQQRETAFSAVHRAISASFSQEDLHLYALKPDHKRVEIPITGRSYVPHGATIGALLAIPAGIYLAWLYHGSVIGGILFSGGTGAMLGAAMGLGSWSVGPRERLVPTDAVGFLLAIDTPEGRAASARRLLLDSGGEDASLQPA